MPPIPPPAHRLAILRDCILQHGVRPSEAFPEGDHRVAYTVVALGDNVLFVGAVPPSSVDALEDAFSKALGNKRVIALDVHVGRVNGKPSHETHLEERLDVTTRGLRVPAQLRNEMQHARDLALRASEWGHQWTGTDKDLPAGLLARVAAEARMRAARPGKD